MWLMSGHQAHMFFESYKPSGKNLPTILRSIRGIHFVEKIESCAKPSKMNSKLIFHEQFCEVDNMQFQLRDSLLDLGQLHPFR